MTWRPFLYENGAFLSQCGREKMATILLTTFSSAFSWMKMYEFWFKFHWSLFLRVLLTIFQHWFRWWFSTYKATNHCPNQCCLVWRRIYASLGLSELIIIIAIMNSSRMPVDCVSSSHTSNGSWRQGIKGEMTCTVYVALVWNIIYWIMMIITLFTE